MTEILIAPTGVRPEHYEHFMSKVEVTEGGCWLWKAGCFPSGYGQYHIPGEGRTGAPKRAHRVSYELHLGDIGGVQMDHMCHRPELCAPENAEDCPHRKCVNPEHLNPSTGRDNVLRGSAPTAVNAAKTHCIMGHPLSGGNLYLHPEGSRVCRICRAAARARWRAKQVAMVGA